ncbi:MULTISPECIES: rhodanese-like domain-containing protein [unclassified Streptomyces]|uniref:rhodanese-like domain-containing protein n=1 Tax=unclassified Streptomyces TaxID=2593676 RepID=UPI00203C5DBF|nr:MULTISPECIES: rhodanese-like domain-containing protein [unclassified Streptomyces]MDU0302301.1 rhodanese-like domain-containing protein [Streptomyces sp. PAL114]
MRDDMVNHHQRYAPGRVGVPEVAARTGRTVTARTGRTVTARTGHTATAGTHTVATATPAGAVPPGVRGRPARQAGHAPRAVHRDRADAGLPVVDAHGRNGSVV